ncbi:heat shock protein 70 family [Mycena epipterygia]|nr:heat shock protein 70 family [Mycena epipterygia]
MPDHSTWLDVLSGLVFLVGLTFYASRMIPPAVPKEPPWIPAKWNRSGPIIGIDIGTTYSRIGFVASEHRVKVFDAVPSRICVTKNDNFVEHMGITGCSDPGSITHTARGLIRSTHAAATTQYFRLDNDQHELDSLSAQGSPISPGSDQQSSFPLPSSILAALLYELYTRAETYYASRISQAIITVPADFSAVERKVITDAALLAGLSPVRLLDEPIAIAIAYGLDKLKNASYALVVDIGSTAHAALLHIEHSDISVISTARNETLGGDAFNRLLSDYVAEAYKNSLNDNLDAMQSLVVDDQVEMAKLTLSFSEQAVIAVPIFGGPWFLVPLTRDDFNNIATDLVEDILDEMIDQMLSNAGIAANVIDHVILAGGSAYIPALRNRFGQRFPGKVPLSASEKYPDEAVVYGAALFARRLALGEVPEETKIYVQDSTPMRFGIEVAGGLFATLIPRNSPLPATNTKRFSLQGGPIRVFTGTGEYTNATEFLGSLRVRCLERHSRG